MRPAEELLYDSEASFRLVDHAIQELSASGAELDRKTVRPDFNFEVMVLQRPRCQSSAVLDFVRLLAIA